VGAREVLVNDSPVLTLFRKDVGAAPMNLVTAAELHGPIKRRDGGSAADRYMRLFDVVGELGRALQIVVKGLAERAKTANPFVLRR